MRGWIIALIAFLALGAGGYYFYTSQYTPVQTSTPSQEDSETTPGTESEGEGGEEKQEVFEVTVEGTEYKFSPDTVTVPKDSKVRLTFKNAGSTGHNFVVRELGVSTPVISPGESYTLEFDAPKNPTTFESACSIPGHSEAGMVGTLVVE